MDRPPDCWRQEIRSRNQSVRQTRSPCADPVVPPPMDRQDHEFHLTSSTTLQPEIIRNTGTAQKCLFLYYPPGKPPRKFLQHLRSYWDTQASSENERGTGYGSPKVTRYGRQRVPRRRCGPMRSPARGTGKRHQKEFAHNGQQGTRLPWLQERPQNRHREGRHCPCR